MTQEERFERDRQESFRTFEVTLSTGLVCLVEAHYHQVESAGALCFYTVEATGRQAIHRAFGRNAWDELREITSDATRDRILRNWSELNATLKAEQPATPPTRTDNQQSVTKKTTLH